MPEASAPAGIPRDAASQAEVSSQQGQLQGNPARTSTVQSGPFSESMDVDKPAQDTGKREPPRGHTSDGRLEGHVPVEDPLRRTLFPRRPISAPVRHDTLDQMLPPQRILPFGDPKLPKPRKKHTGPAGQIGLSKKTGAGKQTGSTKQTDSATRSDTTKDANPMDRSSRDVAKVWHPNF